ncbi:hypothetical protein RRG08_001891 [Elysia crispata]|uniref:Uncharacterized protein n=1 Tax=Elysia crispata TaxID=231223 RepID=A0AAE1DVI7_9GAST|nr:hypothetical protein RRG08_001891 [Elysia crispata]
MSTKRQTRLGLFCQLPVVCWLRRSITLCYDLKQGGNMQRSMATLCYGLNQGGNMQRSMATLCYGLEQGGDMQRSMATLWYDWNKAVICRDLWPRYGMIGTRR